MGEMRTCVVVVLLVVLQAVASVLLMLEEEEEMLLTLLLLLLLEVLKSLDSWIMEGGGMCLRVQTPLSVAMVAVFFVLCLFCCCESVCLLLEFGVVFVIVRMYGHDGGSPADLTHKTYITTITSSLTFSEAHLLTQSPSHCDHIVHPLDNPSHPYVLPKARHI